MVFPKIKGSKDSAGTNNKNSQAQSGKKTETNTNIDTTTTANKTPAIRLSGSSYSSGINLSWTVENMDTSQGFLIAKSLFGTPVYSAESGVVIKDGSARNYTWNITDGKKWYIRICQAKGNECATYSNEIAVQTFSQAAATPTPTATTKPSTTPTKTPTPKPTDTDDGVDEIDLSVRQTGTNKVRLDWNVEGTAKKGFKIVWSKNSKPTYPTRDGDTSKQIDNADTDDATIDDLANGKTYYFRICAYTGSACGTYSNEVKITLDDKYVSSITLSSDRTSGSEVKLTWTVSGESEDGFRVLWSKNAEPTYPLGEGDHYKSIDSASSTSYTVTDLDDDDKYYFRVCEKLDGACGVYSNQVSEDEL